MISHAPMRSPRENPTEVECAKILAHRYGDGTVYLASGTPRALFYACMQLGFINDEGFVTRKGRELLARYPAMETGSRSTTPPP